LSLAVAQIAARPGRLEDAVRAHVHLARAAAELGAKLVIFPELSLTGYRRSLTRADAIAVADPGLEPLAHAATMSAITIVAGAPLDSPKGLLIGSLAFRPTGETATYSKHHLHPGEELAFAAGEGGDLLAIDGANVGLAICAEVNHPTHIARDVARGAAVCAASCFFTPNGYDSDCQRLQGYGKRYGIPVLLSNYAGGSGGFESAGGSAIWDETGQLVAKAPDAEEWVIAATRHDGKWIGSTVPMPFVPRAASEDPCAISFDP
jgi:predicted amidohydrolase